MEKVYLSGYLEGMMNLSSSLSKNIGPSYIKVHCYEKKKFKEDFCKYYKIKENELKLIETDKSLESTLLDWLQDKKMVESIIYWFNIELRDEKKVYLSEELIYQLDDKRKDFYILEDLFFVECKKYIFVFMLGNNE